MTDWQEIVFGKGGENYRRLREVAGRRFPLDEALADEAFNAAFDKLSGQNWQGLAAYSSVSSPEGFLFASFHNALEDFSRARFGRVRPPSWLAKLGGLWLQIYQWLCLERQPVGQIRQNLRNSRQIDDAKIMAMVREIKGRVVHCGASQETDSLDGEECTAAPIPHPGPLPSQAGTLRLQESVLGALGALLEDEGARGRQVREALQALAMTSREWLLLRLIYGEGLSVAKASARLGEPQHTVRRELHKVLQRLRAKLESLGLFTAEEPGENQP